MPKQILAIVGSYRKDGITEQTVDAILTATQQLNANTTKINLTDKHIEFCTNCRTCAADDPAAKRGKCVIDDDMTDILNQIDSADALILASPVNFYNVTAITKRFIERLIVYSYWPWNTNLAPIMRTKKPTKKAVTVTSSACPAIIARIFMRDTTKQLKVAAHSVGAKVVKTIHLGPVCKSQHQQLTNKQLKIARDAAKKLLT